MVPSLIARVGANHFDARADHVATVSLAHEVVLLVVGCVVLVLALVVLAAAVACCCWHWFLSCNRHSEIAMGLYRSTKASAETAIRGPFAPQSSCRVLPEAGVTPAVHLRGPAPLAASPTNPVSESGKVLAELAVSRARGAVTHARESSTY